MFLYSELRLTQNESTDTIETILAKIQDKAKKLPTFTAVVDVTATFDQISSGEAARAVRQRENGILLMAPTPDSYHICVSDHEK